MSLLSADLKEMESKMTVTLIVPSDIIARGLASVLCEHGEFVVLENLYDFSRATEARLRSLNPDVIVIDPTVFDFQSRKEGMVMIEETCDATVIAIEAPAVTEDIMKQYDGSISLYDDSARILRKVATAIESRQPDSASDGNELSSREKEILVCVAQGMLNKEIADKFNLSIYTVITHRKNITRKTGIKTVAGLTVYAILNGLIDINSVQ